MDRQFYAAKPNEKWLTDVTEFKWYEGAEVHKLYLSAVLDLCDRRIVSYVLSERKHRLTRAHREKQLKTSCQALHNAPPNRT